MNNSRIRVEFKKSCLKKDKVTFTPRNVVELFIVYELDTWSKDLNADFTLQDATNADSCNYCYSGYGIKFDSRSHFSFPNSTCGKYAIIFEADNSS